MLRVFKYQDRYEVLLAYFSLFLLSLNNTLVSYTIGGISIDRLLEIITFFLILPFIKKDFFSGKALSFVSIFILCFVALRTLSLIFEVSAGATDLETLAREIVRVVIFLIFFALAYFGCLLYTSDAADE